jgi:gentisate 1,2-dioxygenase
VDELNRVHGYHMYGLWEQEAGIHPVPSPKTEAFMWPADIVQRVIEEAAQAVPIGNERRAVQLFNPGFGGQFATTCTLVGAIQIILPGEMARAHRHTASAIRFITQGSGAYTRVNGERLYMNAGDLVLTPTGPGTITIMSRARPSSGWTVSTCLWFST